jgi:hypothetical protein
MQGYERNWLHSWVVNQDTGLPSKYHELQLHPNLQERERVLSTGKELADWLANPR